MTEGKTGSVRRFSTPTEAILYVAKHNLSRVEADPIFDANEIDRDDAWALVEKARADAKSWELGRQGRGVPETDFAHALDRAVAAAKTKPTEDRSSSPTRRFGVNDPPKIKAAPQPEPESEANPTLKPWPWPKCRGSKRRWKRTLPKIGDGSYGGLRRRWSILARRALTHARPGRFSFG